MNTNAPTTSGNAPVPDPVLRSPGDNTPHGESTWPRVLTVRGLTKTYGAGDTTVDAVRAVDLDLAAGERPDLVGDQDLVLDDDMNSDRTLMRIFREAARAEGWRIEAVLNNDMIGKWLLENSKFPPSATDQRSTGCEVPGRGLAGGGRQGCGESHTLLVTILHSALVLGISTTSVPEVLLASG